MATDYELDELGFIIEKPTQTEPTQTEIPELQIEPMIEKEVVKAIYSTTKISGIRKCTKGTSVTYEASVYLGREEVFDKKKGTFKFKQVRKKKSFKSFEDAKNWYQFENGKKSENTILKKTNVTKIYKLSEVIPECREYLATLNNERYMEDFDRNTRKILAYFEHEHEKYVTTYDPADFTTFYTYLHDKYNYAKSTIIHCKSTLMIIWTYMISHLNKYNVQTNIPQLSIINVEESNFEAYMLNYKQIEELLKESCTYYDPSFLLMVVLTITQGLRRGELCALQWSDINMDTNEVYIENQRLQKKVIKLPKGEKTRYIELHNLGRETLILYKKWQQNILYSQYEELKQLDNTIKKSDFTIKKSDFVFRFEISLLNGYLPQPSRVTKTWEIVYKNINKIRYANGLEQLPEGRLHDNRHIYLSLLTNGVKKDDGTIVNSANLFQSYNSSGHTLPPYLRNTATDVYIEDTRQRYSVTNFWNELIDIDITTIWNEYEAKRQAEYDRLSPTQKKQLQAQKKSKTSKALYEHNYYHIKNKSNNIDIKKRFPDDETNNDSEQ